MYSLNGVRVLEIETTNTCNAACPQCMRTNQIHSREPDYNDVLDWQRAFSNVPDFFWQGLERVNFNGTTGDNAAHPQFHEIVSHVCAKSSDSEIQLSTNGSLRNQAWWRDLATMTREHKSFSVIFGIDGLADTHRLYRVGTDWDKIIENARAFIDAGGRAQWQMIPFQHNQHQIESCRDLARDLGFDRFFVRSENRFLAGTSVQKVYWRGKETHEIRPADTIPTESDVNEWSQDLREKTKRHFSHIEPRCSNIGWMSFYADGTVWPCCWMMGWHRSRHLTHYPVINYHFQKILGIDLSKTTLYNNKLEDIVESDLWQNRLPNSFKDDPNPVCIQQCSR